MIKGGFDMVYFSDSDIDGFISEDMPYCDLTAELLDISGEAKITFFAREDGVVSGSEEATAICKKFGLKSSILKNSGDSCINGEVLLYAVGDAKGVLAAWKPSQNILEYGCSVATATAKMIKAIKTVSPDTHFSTTRKSIPGTKKIAVKGVLSGGGYPHRLGLSESVLIFSQYAALAKKDFAECIKVAKSKTKEHKIAVEVKTIDKAVTAARAGADIVQCDKLTPDEIKTVVESVKSIDKNITVIATGGITIQNISEYASAKPDIIVSSSVYYQKPFDIKVEIERML